MHGFSATTEPADPRTPQPRPVVVPRELAAALAAAPDAARLFEGLALSHRRAYADWVRQAKRPQTKAERVERTLALLALKRRSA